MATRKVGLVIGLALLGVVKVASRCDGAGKSALKVASEGAAATGDVVRIDKASVAVEAAQVAVEAVVEAGDDQ